MLALDYNEPIDRQMRALAAEVGRCGQAVNEPVYNAGLAALQIVDVIDGEPVSRHPLAGKGLWR